MAGKCNCEEVRRPTWMEFTDDRTLATEITLQLIAAVGRLAHGSRCPGRTPGSKMSAMQERAPVSS
jgi:hypothetical protein